MENAAYMFQLRRQPRKPGSGRQRRPLTLPLTSALGGAGAGTKRRSQPRASTKHALTTATGDGCPAVAAGPPAVGTASALGVNLPARHSPAVRVKKQRVARTPPQKLTSAAVAASPLAVLAPAAARGETVVHAFDPTEGRQHRVLVMGFAQGSRRRAQPRTFTLSFKVPPAPRQPTPAASPVPSAAPATLATASIRDTPAHSPAASVSMSPLISMRGRISAAASPGGREPHLDDLVALAFEAARAVEARRQAELQVPSAAAAATPAPGRLPAGPGPNWLAQNTPARPHATPIEGVPERLLLPLTSDRRRGFGDMAGRSTPAGQEAAGTSAKGFTPIEGVPERMPERSVKRMRLSAPFARQLPPLPPSLPQPARDDGPHASRGVPEPLERPAPEADGSSGQPAASPSGATSRLDNLAELQPAEIAAAVSAVARAALQRVRQFHDRLQPGSASVEQDGGTAATVGDVATSSHTCISTPAGPTSSLTSNTPAVVKMHNLAAAAVDAVQRAAEAMGGPPTCRPRPSLLAGLPPRPPTSVSGTPTASGGAAGVAGTAGPAAVQQPAEAADGQAGLDDIIHRAPAGALIFPSRTPSPMGGFRWPSTTQAPLPHLDPGAVRSAGLVTPTLAAAAAAAAAVATGSTSSPLVEQRKNSGAQAGPSCPFGAPAAGAAAGKPAAVAGAAPAAVTSTTGISQQADTAAGAVDDDVDAGWQEDAANDLGMDEDAGYDEQEEADAGAERQEDEEDADAAQAVLALPEEPAGRGSSAEQRSASSSGARASGSGSGERNNSSSAEREAAARAGSSTHSSRRSAEEHMQERRLVQGRKSLAGDGLMVDEGGTRRSTRSRVRPLQYWRGEAKTYDRTHKSLPTVKAIKMRTPEPKWPRPTSVHEKAKRKARTKQAAGLDADTEQEA
ncbi:hypothetical protein HXX76_007445 [Chlamydomonas incerta]|uniref:Uncharacterized protein n=1 Tax=Chlamydomonas incerta TaxID=51695 RepID=A0A835W2Z9_CHLIN|nr:hypothetical protein HXX76_007445 [Chlamydomonas incerta]|eukprot:KAG2435373.1 hypothetical protein HXX76_007445 [Chlamydomonas incerta]